MSASFWAFRRNNAMAFLQALFENGTITLVAMAVLAIEIALILYLRPEGLLAGPIIANGISGVGLLAALGAALTDQNFMVVAACLTLGLIGHLADLAMRFNESKRRRNRP
jgi:hypothetical protein